MLCILREEDALLRSGKPAADDEDLLPREKLTVAGRAVSDPMTAKRLLSLKPYRARLRSRRQENAKSPKRPLARHHLTDIPRYTQSLDLGQLELRAEILRLLSHPRREFRTAHGRTARIIHHLRSDSDLTAKCFFF